MSKLFSVTIDEETPLQGYIAIDSTVNGYCHGGIRMASELSPNIIAAVARTMTLKYGFIGLPMGGAKAGIVADPEMPQARKRQLLTVFGQAIRPFLETRSFIPSGDIGTDDDDIRFMMKSIGLGNRRRFISRELSGYYTAITVFASAVAAARHIGLDLKRATAAIEGFGHVGIPAAQILWQNGIKVKAISTSHGGLYSAAGLDVAELIKRHRQAGSQMVSSFPEKDRIDKSQLPELEVDLFLPCAQPYSIDRHNAGRVSARIISPGANAAITDQAEKILFQRGILSVPDFAANCGGVLGSSMKLTGLGDGYIRSFLEQNISRQMEWLTKLAEKENCPVAVSTRRIAMERFQAIKAAAERKDITSRITSYVLEIYRSGLIPPLLTAPLARWYFSKKLGAKVKEPSPSFSVCLPAQ